MGSLFRQEVLQAQRGQWLGSINLATPLAFTWWMLLTLALAAAVILFLVFGHYTRRADVTGQLEPSAGLFTLPAQITGTVTRTLVHEGDTVKAGQPLVEVSANLVSAMGNTHAVVIRQLRAQETEVRTTLTDLKPQAADQASDLRTRIGMLEAQVAQTNGEVALQRKQAVALDRLAATAGPLHQKGDISTVEYDQYQANALNEQSQLKALASQRLSTQQQLSSLRAQLAQLPMATASKASQLREQLAQLDSQLAQSEAEHSVVLRAPRAGTVSTLLVKVGQSVTSGEPMLSMLPQGSKLQAQLLVPSNAIGFVRDGSPVVLRYQAYPYQKFGQKYGHVVQISRSALSPAEAALLLGQNTSVPLYRVLVAPDSQTIYAYGKTEHLKPGMALNADILLDRRSLWQYVFEPLYGLRQQFASRHGTHA